MKSRFPASLRVIGRSIVDWWDGWMNMVMVTLTWFLASLTIILLPPATFGFYYVVHSMINGEALGISGMLQGAKKYFWKSMVWGLLNLVVGILAWINYEFYGAIEAVWGLYIQVLVVMLTALWISTQFYALPFFMEQEYKKLRVALRNGFLTTMAAPFFTMVLLTFSVLLLGLSVGLVIPFFLGVPALVPVMGFHATYNRLEAFGLRQREKTPKEIEFEEGARTYAAPFTQQETDEERSSRRQQNRSRSRR